MLHLALVLGALPGYATAVHRAPSAIVAAHAVPAFARQTGFACSQCHSQHFPTLNAFGRQFKLDGYTLTGAAPKVEGSRLSLPAVLNASLFMKLRAQKSNGTDASTERTTNSGELQFPDEFALLIAGRVSQNVGFMLEGQLPIGGAGVLAGFKMPFSYTLGPVRVSVIPFTTDGLGAAYGFELLNTGAVRNIRTMEHRTEFSAQQYIGTATAATGAAVVVGSPRFFVNLSRWSPTFLATANGQASPFPTASYARAAYTPRVGAWDLGLGGQLWFGTAKVDDGAGTGSVVSVGTKAWAIDGQAQGHLGTMPLGLFASYASAPATEAGHAPNEFNGGPRARSAFAIAGELGVRPQRATILLGYRHGDSGHATDHADQAITVGGTHHLYQNVQFQVNLSFYSGSAFTPKPASGNQMLTALLAAAF